MDEMSEYSLHLLKQWEAGHEDAATKLFKRYEARLVGLIRSKIRQDLRAKVQSHAVVNSAFRELLEKAERGQFESRGPASLWRFLAAIAINKLKKQQEFYQAQKRRPPDGKELGDDDLSGAWIVDREPSPLEATIVLNELETFMAGLRPSHREILVMHLEGHEISHIAQRISRAEATVRDALRRLERQLKERLQQTL